MHISQINTNSAPTTQANQELSFKKKLSLEQGNSGLEQALPGSFQEVLGLLNVQNQKPVEKIESQVDDDQIKQSNELDHQQVDHAVKQVKAEQPKHEDQQQAQSVQKNTVQQQAQAQAVQTSEQQVQQTQLQQAVQALQGLSSEELMKLLKLQQNQQQVNGELQADTEQIDIDAFPQFKNLNQNQLLSLAQILGQQQSQSAKNIPLIELPQSTIEHITQQAQSLVSGTNQFQNLFTQMAQQGHSQQAVNQSQQALAAEQLTRPQQHLPSINQLQISEAQKNSVIRQITQTFKMQANQKQVTEVRLHPEELGMVKIKVEMQGNDVKVWYHADKSMVNEALAQNIEQLRLALFRQDLHLSQAGLLKDAAMGQRNSQGQQDQERKEGAEKDDKLSLQHKPKALKTTRLPGKFRTTL